MKMVLLMSLRKSLYSLIMKTMIIQVPNYNNNNKSIPHNK